MKSFVYTLAILLASVFCVADVAQATGYGYGNNYNRGSGYGYSNLRNANTFRHVYNNQNVLLVVNGVNNFHYGSSRGFVVDHNGFVFSRSTGHLCFDRHGRAFVLRNNFLYADANYGRFGYHRSSFYRGFNQNQYNYQHNVQRFRVVQQFQLRRFVTNGGKIITIRVPLNRFNTY